MRKKVIFASQHILCFTPFSSCQSTVTDETAGQYCNNSSYHEAFVFLSIPYDYSFPNIYDLREREKFKVNLVYLQERAII